ncbi:MAG: MBL fold metallo-hydrolase [Kofleriaceae bacterium]
MLTSVTAGRYTLRGVSLGGVYTALHVPELDLLFDVGVAPRSFAGARTLCLSHGHVDHSGALAALLGIRALTGQRAPLRVIMPAEIEADLTAALAAMTRMQRWPLDIEPVGLRPGDTYPLRADVELRALRTFHPVPSLGYQLVRTVTKLRPEYVGLAGPEIARRKAAGEPLFDRVTRPELAYATDTLATVLDHNPDLTRSHVLILEATFLDERKSVETARAGCHIHLDELIARADAFANDHIVLMHFSGVYRPAEIGPLLDRRLPADLRRRVIPFVPVGDWPG